MADFIQIIKKLNEDYTSASQKDSPESYSRLSTIFEELGKFMREYIQDITADDIKEVIKRLKRGDTITSQDKDKLKLWIVGDAEDYVNAEGELNNWQKELRSLIDKINALQVPKPDVYTACKLRGLFRDASRVTTDMFFLTSQKDRLNKFYEATEDIDQEERQMLIRLLEQKMKSPDF